MQWTPLRSMIVLYHPMKFDLVLVRSYWMKHLDKQWRHNYLLIPQQFKLREFIQMETKYQVVVRAMLGSI
jgi:hypothetical protein